MEPDQTPATRHRKPGKIASPPTQHAAAPAPPKINLGSLELGRFAAASIVVLTHFFPYLASHAADPHPVFGRIAMTGAIAVQYFFVLSGFVMMTAHRRDFGRLQAVPLFWWRRACRIYPMYWIALGLVLPFLYGGLNPILCLKLFSLAPTTTADLVPPAWSLRYEMAFYIMFGLGLLPYIGRPLLIAWVLCVAWDWCPTVLLNLLHLPPPYFLTALAIHHASHFLAPFEFYFFAGLAGGWIFSAVALRPHTNFIITTAGLLGLLLAMPSLNWGNSYGPAPLAPLTGLAFAALIVGLSGLERNRVLRLGPFARRLGAMSYPLYILHAPLMLILNIHTQQLKLHSLGLYTLFALGIICLYTICAACAFCIDQPIQNLLRRAM